MTFLMMKVNWYRMWTVPEHKGIARTTAMEAEELKLVLEGCDPKAVSISILSLLGFFLRIELNILCSFIFTVCYVPHLNFFYIFICLGSFSCIKKKYRMNPRTFWGKFIRLIVLYSKLWLCLLIYLDYPYALF
jgi:hypothetical protein